MSQNVPTKLAGRGEQLARLACRWIEEEMRSGARLFAVEGLMGAGKTTTCRQIRALQLMLAPVDLDAFLDPRVPAERSWQDRYMMADAVHHVRMMLRDDRSALIWGAICWPTAQACNAETRLIYLKRMQFEEVWADEGDLTAEDNLTDLRRSVRDHHATTKPWLHANLVMERTVEPDGE